MPESELERDKKSDSDSNSGAGITPTLRFHVYETHTILGFSYPTPSFCLQNWILHILYVGPLCIGVCLHVTWDGLIDWALQLTAPFRRFEIGKTRKRRHTARMAYRKWKEIKQQPGTAGPGNMLGCCLASFHFRGDIHPIRPVVWWNRNGNIIAVSLPPLHKIGAICCVPKNVRKREKGYTQTWMRHRSSWPWNIWIGPIAAC